VLARSRLIAEREKHETRFKPFCFCLLFGGGGYALQRLYTMPGYIYPFAHPIPYAGGYEGYGVYDGTSKSVRQPAAGSTRSRVGKLIRYIYTCHYGPKHLASGSGLWLWPPGFVGRAPSSGAARVKGSTLQNMCTEI